MIPVGHTTQFHPIHHVNYYQLNFDLLLTKSTVPNSGDNFLIQSFFFFEMCKQNQPAALGSNKMPSTYQRT